MIEGTTCDTLDHVSDELFRHMIYCNEMRPHQAPGCSRRQRRSPQPSPSTDTPAMSEFVNLHSNDHRGTPTGSPSADERPLCGRITF